MVLKTAIDVLLLSEEQKERLPERRASA